MKPATRHLRLYQWKATQFLTGKVGAGKLSLGLSAPTGAGKTTILHAFLMKTRSKFTGALIAAPSLATEEGFHKDEVLTYERPAENGRTSVIQFEMSADMFVRPREDDDLDKREELDILLSPAGHAKPFYLTTHHQLTRWTTDVLPDDLTGKVLVLDEAHHAGTDAEDARLNTGIGDFARVWTERKGTVVYTTATPFRADGLSVFPEGTERYTWSIAEHAASGFAPANFRPVTVTVDVEAKTKAEVFGEALSEAEGTHGKGYQAMVDRWVADGKPKAVFNVPPGKAGEAEEWAIRLRRALEAVVPDVRIVDSVGTGPAAKKRFSSALKREAKVERYADSTVDVFISCKRFDEGTDWPLCSHVYNWGTPASFGLILQRWGRAFRSKSKFPDYPEEHREAATIVFFLLRVGEDVLAQFERQHHEHALLLACYLADWETAREYRANLRLRFEKAWIRRGEKTEAEELADIESEQAFVVSDDVRNEVLARIAKLEDSLGHPATQGEVTDYLAKFDLTDEEWVAADQIMVEQMPEAEQEAVVEKLRAKLPQQVLRAELRAAFHEVLAEYRDRTVPVLAEVVSFYTRLTGQDATEVAGKLREYLDKPDLTDERILVAAKLRHTTQGRWPTCDSGDATAEFGYPENWGLIDKALKYGYRGMQGGRSLARLLCEAGLKEGARRDLTEGLILEAAKKHFALYGVWPEVKSEGATEAFGFTESWTAVNQALWSGARGLPGGKSLRRLIEDHGLLPQRATAVDYTIDGIKAAISAYQRKHGTFPGIMHGDATEFFGFPTTWKQVDRALVRGHRGLQGGSSLAAVRRGVCGDWWETCQDEGRVKAAMLRYRGVHGKWPNSVCQDDASVYFGVDIGRPWHVAEQTIKRALGRTLRDLVRELCPEEVRAHPLTPQSILRAAQDHHRREGRMPTRRSGDASINFGFEEQWGRVDAALVNGNRGLPGNSSLSKLLKEHGLK